jgi:pSer/pThr/pTyr-binding forkhead associated (FHA) protein
VILDFDDGGTMEVKDGTTLGTELRQHLHDNDVSTKDAMRISRQHLLFKQSPDGFRVVDLESTNGTELNGEELEPNREYDVSDGDQLELGGSAGITVHIR